MRQCQERTELLWIGCLTGLILILKFKIRYTDTKHQLADTLTKGNFTRDEWNSLLHLFNIIHFSSTRCAKNSSLSCSQNDGEEDAGTEGRRKNCGKIKTYSDELVFFVPTSSSSVKNLIASKSPEILTATGKPESRMRRNSKSDAASSSQARLEAAYLGGSMDTATGKPVAAKEEPGDVDSPNLKPESEGDVTGKLVAIFYATEEPYAPSKSDCQGGPKAEKMPQFIIRKQYSQSSGKSTVENMMTQWMIWTWLWLLEAHVCHLGQDYEANLRYVKNNLWNSAGQLFRETGKLILVSGLSISKMLRGCRQAYCAAKLISSPTPKPAFSLTLCSVLEIWEMILLRLGRTKLNGIRKTITSRIWIESPECRQSSSGKYSPESQRWASSSRFKI